MSNLVDIKAGGTYSYHFACQILSVKPVYALTATQCATKDSSSNITFSPATTAAPKFLQHT
jgi:hypothetical protein